MNGVRPDRPGLPDTVPARMVNQFVYCKRLFYLEWVQSRFTTSHDVEEGLYVHRVVDHSTGALPHAAQAEAWEGRRATSVHLSSSTLGLSAKLDLVAGEADGSVVPIDFKKGSPGPDGQAWPSDRVQSVLQALLLAEHGYRCDRAEIWYAATRQRVIIPIDEIVLTETHETLRELWAVAAADHAPAPLVNSPKCPRCSLVGICLPDETLALQIRARERTPARRLMTEAPESRPAYVLLQGAVVGVRRGRLEVFHDKNVVTSYRLIDISQLCVFGNVQVSTQVMRELFAREVPVLWFSYGGWFFGAASGLPAKNIDVRRAQFGATDAVALDIARRMVAGKIRNSRTLLRRNARTDVARTLEQLKNLAIQARNAPGGPSLLGYEGTAARLYFAQFTTMISPATRVDVSPFDQNGRARRPPPDPLNALLSFGYALLVKDLTVIIHSVGLDPYLGFLHRPRFGKPALALDLAEEFRPLIAESMVLQVLNNGELRESDLTRRPTGCQLDSTGRKVVLRAYERRMDQQITHPHFGYQVSYRRALEVQVRLLASHLLGEIPDYVPFMTR